MSLLNLEVSKPRDLLVIYGHFQWIHDFTPLHPFIPPRYGCLTTLTLFAFFFATLKIIHLILNLVIWQLRPHLLLVILEVSNDIGSVPIYLSYCEKHRFNTKLGFFMHALPCTAPLLGVLRWFSTIDMSLNSSITSQNHRFNTTHRNFHDCIPCTSLLLGLLGLSNTIKTFSTPPMTPKAMDLILNLAISRLQALEPPNSWGAR